VCGVGVLEPAVSMLEKPNGIMEVDSERHDSLQAKPRSLKTIEDALFSVSAECKADQFWADMGKPADVAVVKFRESERAQNEEAASAARNDGLLCLKHLAEQMQAASDAGLFKAEARMAKLILDMMEGDPSLTMSSSLTAVAAKAHAAQAQGVDARKQMQASLSAEHGKLDSLKAAMMPYAFIQTQDEPEMEVSIAVPAATSSKDVRVEVTRSSLLVSVEGHQLQPHVVNGRFLHEVDANASGWHLEGTGEKRQLIIDLEKASAGLDWSKGLLSVGKANQ
jgi:HSP20 family molecular chaperone IbpA